MVSQQDLDDELSRAASQGDAAAVAESLSKGARPKTGDDSPWLLAASCLSEDGGAVECLRLLLPWVDPNQTDGDAGSEGGWNALSLAANQNEPARVEFLARHCDRLALNNEGWSALMVAACQGAWEMVEALLSHADVRGAASARDKQGRDALMLAARCLVDPQSRWEKTQSGRRAIELLLPWSDREAFCSQGLNALGHAIKAASRTCSVAPHLEAPALESIQALCAALDPRGPCQAGGLGGVEFAQSLKAPQAIVEALRARCAMLDEREAIERATLKGAKKSARRM